jgi:hypothetical protein
MVDCNEINFIQVVREIQQYLHEHPNAADTLEGITRWWLSHLNGEVSHSLVQQALDILVSESIVSVKKNYCGDAIYSSAVIESDDHRK